MRGVLTEDDVKMGVSDEGALPQPNGLPDYTVLALYVGPAKPRVASICGLLPSCETFQTQAGRLAFSEQSQLFVAPMLATKTCLGLSRHQVKQSTRQFTMQRVFSAWWPMITSSCLSR